jgi:putative DNA primase/helicase
MTKLARASYDAGARNAVWEAFLERVQPLDVMRGFLKRSVGYSLTALTGEQKMFVNYGQGANGKSVFMNALAEIIGDYAATAKI